LLSGHRNRGILVHITIPYEAPALHPLFLANSVTTPFMGVGHCALTLDATSFRKRMLRGKKEVIVGTAPI